MHPRRSRVLTSAMVAAFLLASCGGSDDPPPEVTSTQLNDHGPIFRSLSVELAEAGGVEVEYWTDASPRLLMKSEALARRHEVTLPRLHAEADYAYEVRSTREGQRSATQSTGAFHTAALPADIQAIAFNPIGAATSPLTFLSVRSAFTGGVVIDSDGRVIWYGRTSLGPQGAGRRANGNWVIVEDGLVEFTPLGEKIRSLPHSRMPIGVFIHHSVIATARNTLMFLASEPRTYPAGTLYGESVWEWDPEADLLTKRWSAFDFLDPLVDFGPRSIPSDWFHANSIAIGQHGNVILSFHFLDQILSLAPDFQSIEWRLGGPGSTYTITADQATSGQHSAREVSPGTILLFDNGFARTDGQRYSRALELRLDPVTRTVSTVWQYRPNPDIWASFISSVRRLPNGNSVLTFGTQAGQFGSTGPVSLHEVSPTGELLWAMTIGLPSGNLFQGDPIPTIAGESELR
jgi:hypothetical protein